MQTVWLKRGCHNPKPDMRFLARPDDGELRLVVFQMCSVLHRNHECCLSTEMQVGALTTIMTNPCDHLRGGAVRDDDVRVVPSLFVERVAMVEGDRDVGGGRRVGRLAFGVVYRWHLQPTLFVV